ncbi:glycolate oxidase subunit GlcF [Gluconacetobacter azotocaptans]|uniref:Glycolate oxidase iron-sulfur subunit n=1 Tax=Gluconacetobacter azotocaptans TaxID=142834 RepID=A0A7W4PFI5_9PROT|nr:glycolate oxidase subunit GlcF [Gluconacetobacter azotocaptans]MBB2191833.1 glycolate oxidase subunit GlcF [Gluconacetobacter azotocaptans]
MLNTISPAAKADPNIALAGEIIGACVHCGICLSHCPTYQVRHEENDSPRGRIFLMKEMYERGGAPDARTVEHLDRCLTCLACEAICPSGVEYSRLIGHGREHVAAHYRRPPAQAALRRVLAMLLSRPRLFRMGLAAGRVGRPFRALLSGPLRAMLDMVPTAPLPAPSPVDRPQVFAAEGTRRMRVALLTGCVQTVLDTAINEATIRLLRRHGVEIVVAAGAGCCGAPAEHMGDSGRALPLVKANIAAWLREADGPYGLDAVVVNASGCGTSIKAYGHALRLDPAWAGRAARISAMTLDISELMERIGLLPPVVPTGLRVAYHAACSMQHGQRITRQPRALLAAAGFTVLDIPDGYMCCGSAGTYNLLQPAIAGELKQRKVAAIRAVGAQVAASGNIGCMTQLAGEVGIPFVHTVQLLDWATGGPRPAGLEG